MIVKRNFSRIVRRLAIVAAVAFVVYQFVFFYSSDSSANSRQKVADRAEEVKAVIRQEKLKEKLEQALKEVDPEVSFRFMPRVPIVLVARRLLFNHGS